MRKITAILTILTLVSCSTTKNLTENKLLGKYYWNGVYGVGASIELKNNGVFEYKWVTGLGGGTTNGTWTLEGRKIKFNSEIQPDSNLNKDYEIIKIEQSDTNVLTIKIMDIDNAPIYYANCFLESNNKVIEATTSDLNGYANLNKVDSDSLTIQFIGLTTVKIKYDNTVSKYEIRMKDANSYYEYFTDKKLIFRKDRLYDLSIKKNKYTRKKYYER